jgi:hypothetical protein
MTVFRIRDCIKDAREGKHFQFTAPANLLFHHALPGTMEKGFFKTVLVNAGLKMAGPQ